MTRHRPIAGSGLTGAMACVLMLAIVCFGGSPLAAADDPPPGFAEMIDVRVVNIEAVVTRGKQRVEGLTADDFRLLVDGEEVPIEYFSEVRHGAAMPGVSAAGGRTRRTMPATVPALVPGQPVTTRYLIFIDDEFTIPSRRNSVLRRLADQLASVGPGDRVAIVAWDGRRVELLSSWRPADAASRRILQQAMDRPAYGLQRRSEWSRLQTELRYDRRSPAGGSSFSTIGFSGASRGGTHAPERGLGLSGRVGRLGLALNSALRGFARPDGRKVVLFLSGGLPPVASDFAFDRFDPHQRLLAESRVRRLFEPAVETANRLGYSIYPVDLGDIDSHLVGGEVSSLNEAVWRRRSSEQDQRSSEDSFHFMAESTGGQAQLGGARLTALERVVDDTRSYYWLGFSPAWRLDDTPHELEVEIRQDRRLKVRSRTGFQDLSRQAQLAMQVDSAHLFELPLPSSGQLAVTVGEAGQVARGKMQLPLEIRIPTAALTFLPTDGGEVARVELRIAASDERGDAAAIPVVDIDIRRDQVSEGTFSWKTSLELRRLGHRLLLAVHDPLGETILAQRLEIDASGRRR